MMKSCGWTTAQPTSARPTCRRASRSSMAFSSSVTSTGAFMKALGRCDTVMPASWRRTTASGSQRANLSRAACLVVVDTMRTLFGPPVGSTSALNRGARRARHCRRECCLARVAYPVHPECYRRRQRALGPPPRAAIRPWFRSSLITRRIVAGLTSGSALSMSRRRNSAGACIRM